MNKDVERIKEILVSKKGVMRDFVLNFFASFISVGVVQILLLPWLSRVMNANQYGVMLTTIGVANTITGTIGGSLNNTRLIIASDYTEKKERTDFLPLILIGSAAGVIAILIYTYYHYDEKWFFYCGIGGFVFFACFRDYGNVYYRLVLNYKKILILSIVIASSNVLGIGALYFIGNYNYWHIPFFLGEAAGLYYIIKTTEITKETLRISNRISKVLKIEISLLITTLIVNLLKYLDRLLLLPVLGGAAVSTYTVASYVGKSFGIVMTPLAGVMLSYYSQSNYEMNRNKYWRINAMMIGLAAPFFLMCTLLAKPITEFFFPTLSESAMPILFLSNAAAIVNTVANMTQPAVLKYADRKSVV